MIDELKTLYKDCKALLDEDCIYSEQDLRDTLRTINLSEYEKPFRVVEYKKNRENIPLKYSKTLGSAINIQGKLSREQRAKIFVVQCMCVDGDWHPIILI